jgi:AraC family transcriptional regulator of adaptative response/methylated-DNA-[protein]-cysteine methyltransferase
MPAQGLDLPLDPRGTAFQQRVWQALREIPAGSTASYSELAQRIGVPKKAYAVGEAYAANVIAVAIPCHRVVRKDGRACGLPVGAQAQASAARAGAHVMNSALRIRNAPYPRARSKRDWRPQLGACRRSP